MLQHVGLTDVYLARTTSAMVGAQALVLSALEHSAAGGKNGSASRDPGLHCTEGLQESHVKAAGHHDALPLAREQVKRAISSRIKRQVRYLALSHR